MTTRTTQSARNIRSRTNSLESLNTSFYEEDTVSDSDTSFFSEKSNLSELSNDTLLQICPDPSPITLENYGESDIKDLFTIRLQKSSGDFSEKGECMTKTELLQILQQDRSKIANLVNATETPPKNFMSIAIPPKDHNKTGTGYKPTAKIVVLLNLSNSSIYITLGSLKRIITEKNKVWYAVKLFNGKPRRVGNLSGLSTVIGSNHAQIPGYYIYKLFTKNEIENGVHVHEELSDYFVDDTNLQFYKTFDSQYLLTIFDRYFRLNELLDRPPTPSSSISDSVTPRASELNMSPSASLSDYPPYISPNYIDIEDNSVYSSSMYDTESEMSSTESTDLNVEDIEQEQLNQDEDAILQNNENETLSVDNVFTKFPASIYSINVNKNILYADSADSMYPVIKFWDLNTNLQINKLKTPCPFDVSDKVFYYCCRNKIKSRNVYERDRSPTEDTLILEYTGVDTIYQIKIYKFNNIRYLVMLLEDDNPSGTEVKSKIEIYNLDSQQTPRLVKSIPVFTFNAQKFVYNNQGELYVATSFNTIELFSLITGQRLSQIEFNDNNVFSEMVYYNRDLYVLFNRDTKLYRLSKNNQNYITSIINLDQKIKTFCILNNVLFASTKTDNSFFITVVNLNDDQEQEQEQIKVKYEINNMIMYQNSLFYDQNNFIISRQIKTILRPSTPTLMLPESIRNAFFN